MSPMTISEQIITIKETDAKVYCLSGKSASLCRLWNACGLLSEKCFPALRYTRHPGADCDRNNSRSSSLEKADAVIHRRRDDCIYAARAACF